MIYVNQKQLDQVEYLLEQSAQGHHVLFDVDDIRRVFAARAAGLSQSRKEKEVPVPRDPLRDPSENPSEAERHIENLILQPTILSKRTYLENLTPEMYEEVIRTYFSIVENNIFEGMEFNH